MSGNIGKWNKSYDKNRKYQTKWEKTYVWLKKASDGSEDAFCKLCHCTIVPRANNLTKHEATEKHKQKTRSKNQSVLQVIKTQKEKVCNKTKAAELQFAVAVTCHSAIRSVDHFGEIMKFHGKGSTLENIKLHRTKCANLIKNVIAPGLKTELIKDWQGQKYAIILDESTDISTQKHLCILARFFSEQRKEIVTGFVGLIPVLECTGENLFTIIKDEVTKCGQTLTNCIGYASDGASAMIGSNNSVWSRLKEVSPNCIQLRCICHSLALCIQYAVAKLPGNIGFLLSEIPHWFRHSELRREGYKKLFNVMNTSTELEPGRVAPLPFEKPSSTRWLVRGKVMFNILMNWEELKAYFTCAELQQSKMDIRYKARLLKEMLSDQNNYLYFEFSVPIVQEFERLNALFQHTKADPHYLYQNLFVHHQSLKSRLYDFRGQKKNFHKIDFGVKFLTECEKHTSRDTHREIDNVKTRCSLMLEEALSQVERRLPPMKETFQGLSKLSPLLVLNQATRPLFSDMPCLHLVQDNITVVEEQYRKLIFVDWKEEVFKKEDKLPTDSESFWVGVLQHDDFKELAAFALTCLITPMSNAIVERVFSLVTSVKTKARNRMQLHLLDSIVRIRSEFLISNKCCKDFVPSPEMLRNFTSDIIYCNTETDSTDDLDLFL